MKAKNLSWSGHGFSPLETKPQVGVLKAAAGFTIIEVLIVLAIAGLILLIVFLAVPALQRNGRNTTKRSDASKALGAVGEFMAATGKVAATADLAAITSAANLSNGTTLTATIPTTVATITVATTNQIEIVTGVICTGTHTTAAAPTAANFQAEVQAASPRSYVALFTVDAAGGNQTTQCVGA
ncbi:MAG TPA: type II secretion system protein [Candidatus Saccharimonadales bacterium]|nr:type II secretion system protein [Candidatus Saccharimonadales bacterium]